jgi:hypothetical protein
VTQVRIKLSNILQQYAETLMVLQAILDEIPRTGMDGTLLTRYEREAFCAGMYTVAKLLDDTAITISQ